LKSLKAVMAKEKELLTPGSGTGEASMTFMDHLKEFRNRLIYAIIAVVVCSIVCWFLYDPIVGLLTRPFSAVKTGGTPSLFVNMIYEGFVIRLKIAMVSGLAMSSPVLLYHVLKFIFPGLKPKEKNIILYALVASFVLIVVGLLYGYITIIPTMVSFFLDKGFLPAGTGILLNFGRNIFYVFEFLLITILVFQLPVILEILLIMNILKRKDVFAASRFVIVGIFVLAAVVTPSVDAVTQIAVALPLVGLFFLTILIAKIFKFGEG
jgi:sec-independent protein translocase protein TatC